MVLGLQTAADPAVVGFDAGWKLEFRREDPSTHTPTGEPITLTRDRYYAQIKVDTATAFRGGTFEIAVDGLSDEDFAALQGGDDGVYTFVDILLGWRDLGSGFTAAFADVGKLLTGSSGPERNYHDVLHGRIRSCERVAGEYRYRTTFTGVDHRWERLRCTEVGLPLGVSQGDPAATYASLLCAQARVPIVTHPPGEPGEPIDALIEIPEHTKVSAALSLVARTAHGEGADRRIPMFLRTDGLHFGPWLAPVVARAEGSSPPQLDLSSGLVECKPVVDADPEACRPDAFATPTVTRHDLVLRGRADLRVGDEVMVALTLPSSGDSGKLGAALGGIGDVIHGVGKAFGAGTTPEFERCRVLSVKHELDRTKGFVTTMRVEAQPEGASVRGRSERADRATVTTIDEAARTAAALAVQANQLRRDVEMLDIGEVNAQHLKPGTRANHSVAAQRLDIQEGLVRDGEGNSTVRADRAPTPTQLFNKPYLTLFAFGRTGLVVPHYPGMRVANLHYRGEVSQSMAAGCLWRDGDAPDSQPGDWWLSLPIDVSPNTSVDDSRQAATPSGPASHDLIDGQGGRAVHVRGLKVGVGSGKLPSVGERPGNATADEILIEHTSGARLHIDKEGNITIAAASGKNLRLEGTKITLAVQDTVEVV
jgi:hypothetical protein